MKLPDEFDWKKFPKPIPGVYVLVHHGEVIYVGRVRNILNRYRNYYGNQWFRYFFKDEVPPAFRWLPISGWEAQKLFRQLLNYCQPVVNFCHPKWVRPKKDEKTQKKVTLRISAHQPYLRILREPSHRFKVKRPMRRRKATNVLSNHGS